MSNLEQLRAIAIDPEFESVCRKLTEDEANQLEANILSDGAVTSPLIVWDNILLDGHNRRQIIFKHPDLEFTIREMSFASRYDAVVWICKNQLGRRNLTEQNREYLIGKQYNAERAAHGSTERFQGKAEAGASCVQNEHMEQRSKQRTRDRVAKENGVSAATVQRASWYADGIDAAEMEHPGIKEEILSGSIRPAKQDVAAIAKAPAEERKQLVEDLMKPKDNTQKKPKAAEPEEPDKKRTVSIANIAAIGSELGREKEGNNVENVLGIIRGAVHDFLWTCEINLNDFPELLDAERPRLQAELIELKTYIDSIFKEVINA